MKSRDDTMAAILETIDEEAKAKDAEAKEAKEEEGWGRERRMTSGGR